MDYSSYESSFSDHYIDPSLLTSFTPNGAGSSSLGDSTDYTRISNENHQFKLGDPEQTAEEFETGLHYNSSLPDLSWSDQLAQSAVYPSPTEPTNSSCSASPYRPQEVVTGQYNDSALAQTLLGDSADLSSFETKPFTSFTGMLYIIA